MKASLETSSGSLPWPDIMDERSAASCPVYPENVVSMLWHGLNADTYSWKCVRASPVYSYHICAYQRLQCKSECTAPYNTTAFTVSDPTCSGCWHPKCAQCTGSSTASRSENRLQDLLSQTMNEMSSPDVWHCVSSLTLVTSSMLCRADPSAVSM